MQRPDRNLLPHRLVLAASLAAALLAGLAPAARAGDTAPGASAGKPPGVTRGGDGVGGIEKGAAQGPGAPSGTNSGPPGGGAGATGLGASAGWTDAGGGLPGEHVPELEGAGGTGAGQPIALRLRNATAAVPATLFVGLSAAQLPFKGGTLMPSPDLVVAGLPTDATGSLLLQATLPAQLPPGLQLWMQLWVPDAGAPQGLAATNALRLVLP
jgi:hypothetical protein